MNLDPEIIFYWQKPGSDIFPEAIAFFENLFPEETGDKKVSFLNPEKLGSKVFTLNSI